MKILLVTEDVPVPNLGGAGKHAVLLGNTLIAAGHQVEILGRRREPGVETSNDFKGPLQADIDFSRTGWKEHTLGVFHALRRWHMARRIWQAIQRRGLNWDVIHYHGHMPLLGAMIPAHINFVHTLHDQGSECMTKIRFLNNEPCRTQNPADCARCATKQPNALQTYVSAHAVRSLRSHAVTAFTRHQAIFVSQFLADRFRAAIGPAELRAHVVHNFIDAQQMQLAIDAMPARTLSGSKPTVFLAGRIDRAKGFTALFDAMPDSLIQRLDIQVAGDGPDLAFVRKKHESRGVKFLGWQSLHAVLQATANADACVMPSILEESCGTTMLEALALGRPVYALARGGTPELAVYQQYPGQLHLFENMAQLAGALADVQHHASAVLADTRADVRARLPDILATYEAGLAANIRTMRSTA